MKTAYLLCCLVLVQITLTDSNPVDLITDAAEMVFGGLGQVLGQQAETFLGVFADVLGLGTARALQLANQYKAGPLSGVLGIAGDILGTAVRLVEQISTSLLDKSSEEQSSVFDLFPLDSLCPLCVALPQQDQIQVCQDFCYAKGWVSTSSTQTPT